MSDGKDDGNDNEDNGYDNKDDCDDSGMIQWQQRKSPALRDIEITRARVTGTTCVLQIVILVIR